MLDSITLYVGSYLSEIGDTFGRLVTCINSADKSYKRFRFCGCSFPNLLVCFAGIADYPGNSGGVQQVDYVSGGEAYFFTRGAVQRGTWQKASPEHPLKVYAADAARSASTGARPICHRGR